MSLRKDEVVKRQLSNLDTAKLSKEYISYTNVLEDVKASYTNLYPKFVKTLGGKDGAALPSAAFLSEQISELKGQVGQLNQTLSRSGGVSCDWCKKPGKTKRTCDNPECAAKWAARNNGDGTGKNTPEPGKGKLTAPKEGEPHTKVVDGATYKWDPAGGRRGKGFWVKQEAKQDANAEAAESAGSGNLAAISSEDTAHLPQGLYYAWGSVL